MRAWLLSAGLVACGARTPLATGTAVESDAGPRDAASEADARPDATPTACGGSAASQLAATASSPDTIAIDGGFVYWHDDAGVFRVPITGGTPEQLASVAASFFPDLSAFALGGGYVFFADAAGDVERVPVSGGSPVFMGLGLANAGFAASASFVRAWPRNGAGPVAIRRFDFDAQSFHTDDVPEPPNEMFLAGEDAYVAADPGVYEIPFGSSSQILSGLIAVDLVVDADHVYFTSDDATNGARVVVLTKQTLKTVDVPDTFGAFAIATDGTDLFFTDANAGRVRRIDGKIGPVHDVAGEPSDHLTPVDLVVDGACVYWTNRSNIGGPGAILVAPEH